LPKHLHSALLTAAKLKRLRNLLHAECSCSRRASGSLFPHPAV